THSRGEAERALLVWRRHDADMPTKALLVLVAEVGQRDVEVLPRLEVDLLVLEVEGHQQCPLRDLALLLDRRTHRLPPFGSRPSRRRIPLPLLDFSAPETRPLLRS